MPPVLVSSPLRRTGLTWLSPVIFPVLTSPVSHPLADSFGAPHPEVRKQIICHSSEFLFFKSSIFFYGDY